jgi:hypothetical protein
MVLQTRHSFHDKVKNKMLPNRGPVISGVMPVMM